MYEAEFRYDGFQMLTYMDPCTLGGRVPGFLFFFFFFWGGGGVEGMIARSPRPQLGFQGSGEAYLVVGQWYPFVPVFVVPL